MKPPQLSASDEQIITLIRFVRNQRVILDFDLSKLYQVPTKRLNEQFRRNVERFPQDFAFQLSEEEWKALRSQIPTLKPNQAMRSQIATASRRNIRYLPYAFTEHGALQAANVLNSPRAVAMSVYVIRAFIKMRAVFLDTRELARKLTVLEKELKGRLDVHEAAIVDVLQRIMTILDPPPSPPEPPKPQIGFKEDSIPYRVRKRPARL